TLGERQRGRLRVYLGSAPGIGKTYAMLDEAKRRAARGTDVVVGLVDDAGRPRTAALLDGLAVVPPRTLATAPGHNVNELDLPALLDRKPELVLADDLGHTCAPGGLHPKRWQEIEELLDAGVDVITTLNIDQIESLSDVAEQLTGMRQPHTVPDAV